MTLGRIGSGVQIEPDWRINFVQPPPASPNAPQNLIRASVQSVVEDVSLGNLGKVRRMLGEAEPPPAPSSNGNGLVATQDLQPAASRPRATTSRAGAYAPTIFSVSAVSAAASAYHGYKRNESLGWAAVWAVAGAVFPLVTPAIGLAQGWGKRVR